MNVVEHWWSDTDRDRRNY